MTNFKTLNDLPDIAGAVVLVRVDLNVPFKDGKVTDNSRLQAILPTLNELISKDARIVLLSHFGRPEGQRNPDYSLQPVASTLNALINDTEIQFVDDCIGEKAKNAVSSLKNGDVLICENLRFHAGETDNDPQFAKELASLGEIFISDAFSATHRAHASTVGIADYLPAYAGRLMEAELNALSSALQDPAKPVTAIVGGSKISTKLSVLHNLIEKTDNLILGGAMANTFLYAIGHDVGISLYEPHMKDEALSILEKAEKIGCNFILPKDVVVAKEFKGNAAHEVVLVSDIPADTLALDIGPESVKEINDILNTSKTLLWNGPVGAFETPPFEKATVDIAKHATMLALNGDLYAIGGGGDTVAALEMAKVKDDFSYISTAGGAFLEYIEGKTLPGVAALEN
mgnify:CR=1 FL=1